MSGAYGRESIKEGESESKVISNDVLVSDSNLSNILVMRAQMF